MRGAALKAGEDGGVELLAEVGVVREDHAAAGAAEGFVGGGGRDVGVRQGRGEDAGGDQAGEVRHVDHEEGAHFVGDSADAGEVDGAGIGGAAGDDELGALAAGELLELLVVEGAVIGADAVLYGVEPFAGEVRGGAVREVSAGGEAHAEDGVAGLEEGEEDGLVGLGAGMGLDVGVGAAEELLGAFDGEGLGAIDFDATAVVAATGVAFGIFVGEDRALGFEHRGGDDVLAGDQFDTVLLAAELGADGGGEFGIRFGKGGCEEAAEVGRCDLFVHGVGPFVGAGLSTLMVQTKRMGRIGA